MEWELYCEAQAQLCERRAAEPGGPPDARWLEMAADWRLAATEPQPPFVVIPPSGAADVAVVRR